MQRELSNLKLEVSLVSELISYAPTQVESFSDPSKLFDYLFYNDGGTEIRAYPTSPCVKPDSDFDPKESILSGLEWDLDSDPIVVEYTQESYENLTFTGSHSEGWHFTYSIVNKFEVEITAENLAKGEYLIRDLVENYLAIFDSGTEEVLEIEEVRLVHQK